MANTSRAKCDINSAAESVDLTNSNPPLVATSDQPQHLGGSNQSSSSTGAELVSLLRRSTSSTEKKTSQTQLATDQGARQPEQQSNSNNSRTCERRGKSSFGSGSGGRARLEITEDSTQDEDEYEDEGEEDDEDGEDDFDEEDGDEEDDNDDLKEQQQDLQKTIARNVLFDSSTSIDQKPSIARLEPEKSSAAEAAGKTNQNGGKQLSDATTPTTVAKVNKQQQGTKKAQKPRRRVATLAQRRAANIRERRRMFNLNAAFDRLRKKVPSFAYEKRLSRIETLKLAIMYIRFMDDLVNDDAYAEKYKRLTANTSSSSAASSGFLSSGSYLSLYGHCGAESPSPQPPLQSLHQTQATRTQLAGSLNNQQRAGPTLIGRQPQDGSQCARNLILHPLNSNSLIHSKQRGILRPGQTLLERVGVASTNLEAPSSLAPEYMSYPQALAAGFCNESQCQLSTALVQQQQQQRQCRAKALQLSPLSSSAASLACCSSPTSSSVATCHSSQSLNESPNSSPIVQQELPAPTIAHSGSASSGGSGNKTETIVLSAINTTTTTTSQPRYCSQAQCLRSNSYSTTEQQQLRSISSSSPYYGSQSSHHNSKALYYNDPTASGSNGQPSELELSPLSSVYSAIGQPPASSHLGCHEDENSHLSHLSHQQNQHQQLQQQNYHLHQSQQQQQQQHQQQQQQQHQQQPQHQHQSQQVTSYSLHSLEAR